MKQQVVEAAYKATPPVGVTAWHFLLGLPIEKWVSILTALYVLLQMGFLIYDRATRRRSPEK